MKTRTRPRPRRGAPRARADDGHGLPRTAAGQRARPRARRPRDDEARFGAGRRPVREAGSAGAEAAALAQAGCSGSSGPSRRPGPRAAGAVPDRLGEGVPAAPHARKQGSKRNQSNYTYYCVVLSPRIRGPHARGSSGSLRRAHSQPAARCQARSASGPDTTEHLRELIGSGRTRRTPSQRAQGCAHIPSEASDGPRRAAWPTVRLRSVFSSRLRSQRRRAGGQHDLALPLELRAWRAAGGV